jgi:hypothetical protein
MLPSGYVDVNDRLSEAEQATRPKQVSAGQ